MFRKSKLLFQKVGSTFFNVLLFVVIAVIIIMHLLLQIPAADAGVFMYGSMLITKGHLPYIDLWDNKPPIIYLIGCLGYIYQTAPFVGVRILEVAIFIANLYMIKQICTILKLSRYTDFQLSFCVLYLTFWDQGFLTETFNIPIVLLAFLLFLKRINFFELILAFLIVSSFFIKQNSIIVLIFILVFDLTSNYRRQAKGVKILSYAIYLFLFSVIAVFLIIKNGMLQMFLQESIYSNFRIIHLSAISAILSNHLSRHLYLSIFILSILILFHIVLLKKVFRVIKTFLAGDKINNADTLMSLSVLAYISALYFTYMSGKTYPHYFLLLIVPVSFIIGTYTLQLSGKFIVFILFVVGITYNIFHLFTYYQLRNEREETINFIINHTNENDCIYAAGNSDAWIYIATNRLSCSKFVNSLPFNEAEAFTQQYGQILSTDILFKKPKIIILNKADDINAGNSDKYFKIVKNALVNYTRVYENNLYVIYNSLR